MAATLFSVFFITGAISQPIAGVISDKYGERLLLISLSGLHTICLISLPFINGILPLTFISFLLGTRAGLAPVNNAYLAASIPKNVQGSGLGLLRSIFIGIGATASVLVGFLADNYSFEAYGILLSGIDLAFIFLGLIFSVATLCYFLLHPTKN
jgi:MFS family permease